MKIKSAALFVMVASAIWLLMALYQIVNVFTSNLDGAPGLQLLFLVAGIFVPVALFLFALSVFKNKVSALAAQTIRYEQASKIKSGAVMLLIFSILWLVLQVYYISRILQASIDFGFGMYQVYTIVGILSPLALLLFAIAVQKKMGKMIAALPRPASGAQTVANGLTVGDWVLTFLITIIPVAGLVMLIVWAMDDNNPRRNWARASLIWACVQAALIVFVYYQFFHNVAGQL